jgi:tRNA pseudouridine38-40 synthase
MRVRLDLAFDGTDFSGWATQPDRRTVQGTLTEAVRQISGEDVEIQGASRTDAGAHARHAVAHFDSGVAIPGEKWERILNARLPLDISILKSRTVPESFNARFCVIDRWYRYRIVTGPRLAHRSRWAYDYNRPLNLSAMQLAASQLQGEHDFRAFTEELEPTVHNTVRHLFQFKVSQVRDEVWVDVTGTAFLRGMMRRMSGCILEVGRGYRNVEEVSKLLNIQERNELDWPVVLPARGLCLMRVRCGRHPKDTRPPSSHPQ